MKKSIKVISLVLALALCVCVAFAACSKTVHKAESISTENVSVKVGEGFYVAAVVGEDYRGNTTTENYDDILKYATLRSDVAITCYVDPDSAETDVDGNKGLTLTTVEDVEKNIDEIQKSLAENGQSSKYISDGYFLVWSDTDEDGNALDTPVDVDDTTFAYIKDNSNAFALNQLYVEATAAGTATFTHMGYTVNVTITE